MNAHATPARVSDHPIDAMFLERHSPRAFTDRPMAEAELLTLLEAARWAPSAANHQPARFVWGLRGDAGFGRIAEALAPGNRVWAEKAAALVVVASKTVVERDGVRSALGTHAFDAGAAWMSLALQAHLKGWIAHAMGGFDKIKAAEALHMPADHELHAVVALGELGAPDLLPEAYRPREVPSGRVALSEIARRGSF
ncbi:nitroreductase [bacterium]|nr:nitroreductase [bacterium]